MFALLRYTLADTFDTQRWVAPVVSLGVIVSVVSAQTGSLLPTYAILATAMVFIGTWLTVIVINNEDPVQQNITESCAGSRAKVRLGKLLFSFVFCTTLGILAMVPPIFLSSDGARGRALLAGVCAQAIAALGAVALGSVCSRPIVRRHAWSVLVGVLVGLGSVLIPDSVPLPPASRPFQQDGPIRSRGADSPDWARDPRHLCGRRCRIHQTVVSPVISGGCP